MIMASMEDDSTMLLRRQNLVSGGPDEVYDGDGWYSSVCVSLPGVSMHSSTPAKANELMQQTAYIVKWSIIGGIFLLFILFILAAYFHAQARMKKGLRPLGYHRVRRLYNVQIQSYVVWVRVGMLIGVSMG
jgi:hypothetical protein